jgi:type II secretory pathway pseudopilin PulG
MNVVLIGIAILLAALVIRLVLQSAQGQKKNDALENQMGELRRDLQTVATAQAQSTGQIQTMGQTVSQRLGGDRRRWGRRHLLRADRFLARRPSPPS